MSMVYLKDVVTLSLDQAKCKNCGMCLNVCPRKVFSMMDGKLSIAKKDYCIECGACMKNCPFEAVTVKSGVGCATAYIQSRSKGKCCCGDDVCCE